MYNIMSGLDPPERGRPPMQFSNDSSEGCTSNHHQLAAVGLSLLEEGLMAETSHSMQTFYLGTKEIGIPLNQLHPAVLGRFITINNGGAALKPMK